MTVSGIRLNPREVLIPDLRIEADWRPQHSHAEPDINTTPWSLTNSWRSDDNAFNNLRWFFDSVSPAIRELVLKAYLDAEAYCLNTYYTASRLMAGGKIGSEASCNKIFWSELDREMHRTAMSLIGAKAELTEHNAEAVDAGSWLDGYMFSLAGPIYAGTNEIQRNIIAERCLGLPKG